MKKNAQIRYAAVVCDTDSVLLVLIFWNINCTAVYTVASGRSSDIHCRERQESRRPSNIVWHIRLAAYSGGSCSWAGLCPCPDFLLQTFFDNPIAGPFVLGISSGAKLVVALVDDLSSGKGPDRRVPR